jgi:hypothetical protein
MHFPDYDNKVPYPKKPSKPCLSGLQPNESELENYAKELSEFSDKETAYKINLDAHRKEDARLHALFKQDLFKDLGIVDHPKKDKIFSLAWQLGHSNGLSEVASYADDIVATLFAGE